MENATKEFEDQLWLLWLKDPNKVEQLMLDAKSKKEESKIRELMKEFSLSTGLKEKRVGPGMGTRVMGTGLSHEMQQEFSEIDTFYGIFSGNKVELELNKKEFLNKNSEWLKEIGFNEEEIKDLFLSSKKEAFAKIASKIEENKFSISLETTRNTPEELIGGVLQFIWNELIKTPGNVVDCFVEDKMIYVTVDSKAGKFVGKGGLNIDKMKATLRKDISVSSIEDKD